MKNPEQEYLERQSLSCAWNIVRIVNQGMAVTLTSEQGKLSLCINDETIRFGRNDDGASIKNLILALASKLPERPPFICHQKFGQLALELLTQLLTEMGRNGIYVQFLTCPVDSEPKLILLARVGDHTEEQVGLAGDPYSQEYFLGILQSLYNLFVLVQTDLGELAFAS